MLKISVIFVLLRNNILTKSLWNYLKQTSGCAVNSSIQDSSGSAGILWNRFRELPANPSLPSNSMNHTVRRTVKASNECGTNALLNCSEPQTSSTITLPFAMTTPLALTISIAWLAYIWTNGWQMMKSIASATNPEIISPVLHHFIQKIPTSFNHNWSWTI